MSTKSSKRPVMKKPNMTCEQMRRMLRTSLTSDGRAIEAPANNSFFRISTGLNQYSVVGLVQ